MHSKSAALFVASAALCVAAAAHAQEAEPVVIDTFIGSERYIVPGPAYVPARTVVIPPDGESSRIYPPDATEPNVPPGSDVDLFTEVTPSGRTQVVKRVTSTTVEPDGDLRKTVEDTRYLPGGVRQHATTTMVNGTVQSYDARAISLTQADGQRATYFITSRSELPAGLAVGSTVEVVPVVDSSGRTVVGTVTVVNP